MLAPFRDHRAEAELTVKGLFADETALHTADLWARSVLEDHDVDPASQPVLAIRTLRGADRRLTLVAGRYLVDRLNGSDKPSPATPRPPGLL
jgi:hypothetical protein